MKQVEAKILQQSYLLACKPGQEERLMEAVRVVDDAMTRIHDAGKVRARERIAVLAALNLAFELGDLRQAADEQSRQAAAKAAEAPAQDLLSAAETGDATTTAALRQLVARLDEVLAVDSGAPHSTDPASPTPVTAGLEPQ